MEKKIALTIKNLSFQFHSQNDFFFKNLKAEFEAGTLHFIRGHNGAGKSTFFRILRGAINKNEKSSGDICVQEQCFTLQKNGYEHLSNYIRMVPQKFDRILANQFSFIHNLKFANIPNLPGLTSLPDHQPIPEFVKKLNIDMDQPVKLLSGGQRQILAILMALQKTTKILLLDEPTAALDDRNAHMVLRFLASLVQIMDLTVLIICHDKELVQQHAQKGFFEIGIDNNSQERTITFIPML